MRRLLILLLILTACAGGGTPTTPAPKDGQPPFPSLGQYWVIDNGCHFRPEVVKAVDATLEKLRTDGIAEVAIVCQTGVKSKGSMNDELIWLRDWARAAKLGNVKDERALVWLIRPDVSPESNRLTIEVSQKLYWYTAMDYAAALEEAAAYANYGDFSGALESLARNTDEVLRQLWQTHQ